MIFINTFINLKNDYIDKLDDIVYKYNNTYPRTIKMKPVLVKSNTYIDSSKEINGIDHKLKLVILLNIFAKGYAPNWLEEVFVIVINELNGEEIAGTFYEKELLKPNQKEFRIEKVIKGKGDKLYTSNFAKKLI